MTFAQIGKLIRKYRQERNFSQQTLAEKIGVTWEMISRYERGRSSPLQKILEISDALGVAPGVFFDSSVSVSGELRDSTGSYTAESSVVPMLSMLPLNPEEIQREVKRTPYFYGLSLPVANYYEKSKIFCIDLQKVNITIQTEDINQKGFLLLTFYDKTQAVDESIIHLIHKAGKYLLVKGTRDLSGNIVIGRVIEYTVMY